MKIFKSNAISEYLSSSTSKHASSKDKSSSYLFNTFKKASDTPSLILLSDGTYKQKQRRRNTNTRYQKKGGLQKAFSKLARNANSSTKSKSSSLSSSFGRVLEAVTIQYPGIATDGQKGGVELDLSFDTAATIDFSEENNKLFYELDDIMLGTVPPSVVDDDMPQEPPKAQKQVKIVKNSGQKPASTSTLGRFFPKVFDDEGYIKCLCGPEEPVTKDDDELSLSPWSRIPSPKKAGDQSKEITAVVATGDHSNYSTANDSTVTNIVKDSYVPTENVCNRVDEEKTKPTAAAGSKPKTSVPFRAKKAVADNSVDASRNDVSTIGPVSVDAFFILDDLNLEEKAKPTDTTLFDFDEASKREADHLALMEQYKTENGRLQHEIARLNHLNHFKAEYDKLKDEVMRLEQEMGIERKEDQNKKTKDDLKQTQKEWEEGLATGLFVRIANMFDDEGFIKCMSPNN